MRTIEGLTGLRAAVGEELGVSRWVEVDQAQIDAFAAATGDRNWIHVDPERAAATPVGSTIAHGLLTLSLGPGLTYQLLEVLGLPRNLNYGYDKVRFIAPVPVGSRLRLRLGLTAVTDVERGARVELAQTFEVEGGERPVCVAAAILFWGEW